MEKTAPQQPDRLLFLDYLRGYLVIVIIIDHLSRFPSAWQLITGKGLLWATAAEGFVMISGLMIGFVRGRKSLQKPFVGIATKLISRALLLYVWMVIGSIVYIALAWQLSSQRAMPWYDAPFGDWATAIQQVVTMQVPHVWVHFLYLYTIFLLLSVPAIWLLRRHQPWILACMSIIGYIYGTVIDSEWLRMQIIFFIPAIIGFYLPAIKQWWAASRHRRTFTTLTYTSALISPAVSVMYVMFGTNIPGSAAINAVFDIAIFSPARIAVSALWFTALVLLFQQITPWLQAHTRGIVHYFGTHSLTAYVAHGMVLIIAALLIPYQGNFVFNTITGLIVLLGVYWLIKIPIVRRILPR